MNKNRVVLVTGASKRIGRDISKHFHKKGFNVILHFNKSYKEAENLKEELLSVREDSCTVFQADFSNRTSTDSAIKELLTTTERIDVLINNNKVDALSMIVHKSFSNRKAREIAKNLQKLILWT